MCSFAPRPRSTAPACWPWCSPAWAPTACWAAASFATTAAACWPRTRPPARSGECPAPSPMQAWRTRFFRSTPSPLKSSASPAAIRTREARELREVGGLAMAQSRQRRLRLSSPTRLRPLAKRARSLARLPLRDAPHQAAAQPGHEPAGRARPAPRASERIPPSNAPSPRP